jgi:hypothetical protein
LYEIPACKSDIIGWAQEPPSWRQERKTMFDVLQKTSRYINLVATHECNRSCPFCIDKYRGSGEFITIDIVHRAMCFAVQNGIEDVLITGGEPTMHPQIVDIVRKIKSYGLRIIMTTNYSNPGTFRELDGLVDCFNVSWYDQPALPIQIDFKSDLTLHAIIHSSQLSSKKILMSL